MAPDGPDLYLRKSAISNQRRIVMLKTKNDSSSKIKVLSLQRLQQVSGGRGEVASPDAWSTTSNGCRTVQRTLTEWSTGSNNCR
jgi:hypothetical protein